MSEVTVKRIEDIEAYAGKNAIPGIKFRPVARALGVTAWGMAVLEIERGTTGYFEHDHREDGQEEVYFVYGGSGTVLIDGRDELPVEMGQFVRVGPEHKRKFLPGPDGLMLIAIGSTPGKAYEPRK